MRVFSRHHGRAFVTVVIMAMVTACSDTTGSSSDALPDTPTGPDSVAADVDSDTGPPGECAVTSDCPDTPGDCLVPQCQDGVCVDAPAPDFSPCDDDDRCTTSDSCQAGICAPGAALECPDAGPCTLPSCDPLAGCIYAPDPAAGACDDGDPCTEGDACTDGLCEGTPLATCTCASDDDCEAFEDNDKCNGTLHCVSGRCQVDPETVITCDPGGPCVSSVCIAATGTCLASIAVDGTTCDDLNPCTTEDACSLGACKGVSGQCECATDEDCAPLQGATYNLCQGPLVCSDGACVPDSSAAKTCAPPPEDEPCSSSVCDPQSGLCGLVAVPDGTPCATGDACAPDGLCSQGSCEPEAVVVPCDDDNPCTDDFCEPSAGCYHSPVIGDVPCDDGDPCTLGDFCQTGDCVAETVLCDDGDPCTIDLCEPESGACEHIVAPDDTPCAAAEACTAGGTCQAGACVGGEPLVCDDDNPCTEDLCEEGIGCLFPPVEELTPCDDGDACTQEGECEDGQCQTLPIPCGDGDPCTLDDCDAELGCVSTPAPDGSECETNDACITGATCQAGICQGGQPITCEDGPCDTRLCNPNTGACEVDALAPEGTVCADSTACTAASTCEQGSCVPGAPKCDDGDPCTVDTCEPSTGACGVEPVTCPLTPDVCAESACSVTSGSCQSTQVPLCSEGAILLEAVFSCPLPDMPLPAMMGPGWSMETLSGDVGFAVDDTSANPPPPLDDACSLNLNNGVDFKSFGDAVTAAIATSPPFSAVGSQPPGDANLTVRFWEWWDTQLDATVDKRFVALVDSTATVVDEVELEKTSPKLWLPVQVKLAVPQPGEYTVRFRFDSVDGGDNGGAGWFVDRVIVVETQ